MNRSIVTDHFFDESAIPMMLCVDDSYHIKAINIACEGLLDTEESELLGKPITAIFGQNLDDDLVKFIEQHNKHSPAEYLDIPCVYPFSARIKWVRLHLRRLAGDLLYVQLEDITEYKNSLRIIETLTVNLNKVGQQSFYNLVSEYLAKQLGFEYVLISKQVSDKQASVIAGYFDGELHDGEELIYDLQGTPCESIYETGELCIYPANITRLFPSDKMLVDMGVESYFGAPMSNSRCMTIGNIIIMSRQAISNPDIIIKVVEVFSERIAYELEREASQKALLEQAHSDDLCQVFNKRGFNAALSAYLDTVADSNTCNFLFYSDLDQFKVVNDTCGHATGDELLKNICSLIQQVINRYDNILARVGGDEFIFLVKNIDKATAENIANSLLASIEEFRFSSHDGKAFRNTISIGAVCVSSNAFTIEQFISHADIACYIAKRRGKNRVHFYENDDADTHLHESQLNWVSAITDAIDHQRLTLYVQQITAATNERSEIPRYEVLVRMLANDGEVISPGLFLPTAENYNLISKIDAWVIQKSFDYLELMNQSGDVLPELSINLSGTSMSSPSVLNTIKEGFKRTQIPGNKVCFEITETTAISEISMAKNFMVDLKQEFGCRFALDDFGTGVSSLSYLKHLPVDYLKIDGVFVRDIVDDPIDRALVTFINQVSHMLNLKTIAEFVENDEIRSLLVEDGIDYLQGYGIARPVPFHTIIKSSS